MVYQLIIIRIWLQPMINSKENIIGVWLDILDENKAIDKDTLLIWRDVNKRVISNNG